MNPAALKIALLKAVSAIREDLVGVSRTLYEYPETGLNEHRAMALISGMLEQNGFQVDRGIGGLDTAFRACWGTNGPRIAILAEMDALPQLGHACGHNIIAAAALGAALALRAVLPVPAARITVLGTPAEELGIGKVDLIAGGFFEGVDFAMMVHPSSKRQVIKGSLGLAKIRFRFLGKAAHAAAYPEEGINALDGVLQTFNAINARRQHFRQDVRVHGIITEGGTVPNIVPEVASCYYYIRADELAQVLTVRDQVIACAEGAALATGCRLEILPDSRVLAPLRINRAFSDIYSRQLDYLGLPEFHGAIDRNRGSSDVGNVSQLVPTIHPHVPIGDGITIHTSDFARATLSSAGADAVVEGASAMALTALELVLSPEIRKKIHEDFVLQQ